MNRIPANLRSHPLVVDLDNTLLKTDTLVESLITLLFRSPLQLVVTLVALIALITLITHRIC